jgi:hypothetical protein
MNSGNYEPYFLATIQDNVTGIIFLQTMPTGYELTDLELTVTVQMAAFMDLPFYRSSIVLTRGVTIAGINYTLSTSKFVIINSTWDGNFQTFNCHLIPRAHYNYLYGDDTYRNVISAFCTTFGKMAVFLDPTAAWLDYQYLPTGKDLTLNNAQTFFTQLKQKYFIFACDNGNDEILFYTGFTHVASPQYTVTGYRFAVDYNVDQKRQYLWRDENETVHQTKPSFTLAAHPDAGIQCILSLCDLGMGVVLAGGYINAYHGYIYRSTDYGKTWDAGYNTGFTGVYSIINLGGGIILACGNYGGWVLRSADNGVTWTQVLSAGDDTCCCLTDCGNGIVLVGHNIGAGGGFRVYKSTDYGLTFSVVQTFGTADAIGAIVYVGDGVCLMGTLNKARMYRSTNHGSSWSYLRLLGTEVNIYSMVNMGNGWILAGTNPNGQIWKSTDAGLTWAMIITAIDKSIWTLNTLGQGVVLAGTSDNGQVWRSLDYGETWFLVQRLGAENSVRSFLTLGNGSTLAGTGEHAYIYKSLNCAADLDMVHNLGFMPSTAVEPSAYFTLAQPKFQPFQVHLKYQSSDFIRINLVQGGTYDFTCAQVTEILDLTQKSMAWRMLISQTEWLSNTVAGPLPGTIERVASYTPLVTAGFNNNLSAMDNNMQAALDTLDDHMHGPQIYDSTLKTTLDDADLFPLVDSDTTTHVLKKTLWSNIKARVLAAFGQMVVDATPLVTPAVDDLVPIVDVSTAGKLTKGLTWANLLAAMFSTAVTIVGGNGNNQVVATGATAYISAGYFGLSSARTDVYLVSPAAGVLRNFRVRTNSAQSAGGTLVLTVRVNNTDTNIVISIPAGSAASGTWADITHSASVAAGQSVEIKILNNGTGNSAQIGAVSLELDTSLA